MGRNLAKILAIVVLFLAGATALAYALSPKHHTSVRSEPAVEATTTTDATTAPTATTPPPTIPTTTTGPAATVPPPTLPPATLPPCSNSMSAACGQFSWKVPPQPLQAMGLTISGPAAAVVGQSADFNVTVTDSQAAIDRDCVHVDYGDGSYEPSLCHDIVCVDHFGPWDPPAATPDTLSSVYSHLYTSPGSYIATFTFSTDWQTASCTSPYKNTVTKSVGVMVRSS